MQALVGFILGCRCQALDYTGNLLDSDERLTNIDSIIHLVDDIGEVAADVLIVDGCAGRDERLVEVLCDRLAGLHGHLGETKGFVGCREARVRHSDSEGDRLRVGSHESRIQGA